MLTKYRLNKIIKNGGATVDKNGRAVSFSDGWQVSKKDCFILSVDLVEAILKASNAILETLASGEFLGIWIDEGRAYIDISERITERAEALRIGRERSQISIFDWNTGACVYC